MDFGIAQQALNLASDTRLSEGCDKKTKEVAVCFQLENGERIPFFIPACCAADAHFKAYFELMPQLLSCGHKISWIGIRFCASSSHEQGTDE